MSAKKKVTKKAPAKAKKPAKKPVVKKHAPVKKPAPKVASRKPQAASRKPQPKPAAKPVAKVAPKAAPVPEVPAKVPHKPRPLSIQPRSNNRPGGPQQPGMPERRVIDRSRLGAIQGRLFRPGALGFEQRQKLALMVSEVATHAAKPKPIKSQITEELAKLSRAVKATVTDATLKADILNDIDAFANAVKAF